MKAISKESFCEKLLANRSGYTVVRAGRIYDQLSSSDDEIQTAALRWIEEGTEPELSAEGWDVLRLEREFLMNGLAALLTIDWLRKDPSAALAALKEGIK